VLTVLEMYFTFCKTQNIFYRPIGPKDKTLSMKNEPQRSKGHKSRRVLLLRAPLKIHFGGQTNLSASGRRQTKAALASTKADLSSLPENQNLLLAAQKQLLELPLNFGENP
jgi:hypothetical protein